MILQQSFLPVSQRQCAPGPSLCVRIQSQLQVWTPQPPYITLAISCIFTCYLTLMIDTPRTPTENSPLKHTGNPSKPLSAARCNNRHAPPHTGVCSRPIGPPSGGGNRVLLSPVAEGNRGSVGEVSPVSQPMMMLRSRNTSGDPGGTGELCLLEIQGCATMENQSLGTGNAPSCRTPIICKCLQTLPAINYLKKKKTAKTKLPLSQLSFK